MITITRNQARQLRAMFRRCGIKPSGHSSQRAYFSAGKDGLRVRAAGFEAAVEYHAAGKLPAEEFSLPLEFLDRCESRRDDPVTLELKPRNLVSVSWTDGSVPQQVQFDAKSAAKQRPFPELPEQFTEMPAELWAALGHAKETIDHQSSRYALACMQLCGSKSRIVTTDGHQVLFQGGFNFPWSDDVLIPAPAVLGLSELAQKETIRVGRTDNHVALRLGGWTFLLQINKEGKYPRVEEVLPDAESIKSRMILTADDADFLARALPRLPREDDQHEAVTLDLNGQVAVRAKPEGKSRPTEVVLSGSQLVGEPLLITTDRRYLNRALKLGFREIGVRDSADPLVCRDERNQYGWMSLGNAEAIQATTDAIRIASPIPGTEPVSTPETSKRSRSTMSDNPNVSNTDGAASEVLPDQQQVPAGAATQSTSPVTASKRQTQRGGVRKAGRQASTNPIEQAVALKQSLRQTLTQTSELIRSLKRQKKQSRLVASTLKSLKELQHAG